MVFWDTDFRKWVQQQYDEIRHRRKNRGKPQDEYDLLEIQLDKMFESFYLKCLRIE